MTRAAFLGSPAEAVASLRRGEAVRAFETPATSYIVILDAAGRVAYTGIGRDQDVAAAIRDVLQAGTTD